MFSIILLIPSLGIYPSITFTILTIMSLISIFLSTANFDLTYFSERLSLSCVFFLATRIMLRSISFSLRKLSIFLDCIERRMYILPALLIGLLGVLLMFPWIRVKIGLRIRERRVPSATVKVESELMSVSNDLRYQVNMPTENASNMTSFDSNTFGELKENPTEFTVASRFGKSSVVGHIRSSPRVR
jgi:hypothetical protein